MRRCGGGGADRGGGGFTGSPVRSAASLSTATAASSDSRPATSITVNTAVARARTGPWGSSGKACDRQDGRSTLASPGAATAATAVAITTEARAAGILRAVRPARPGSRGQSSTTATVSAPMSGAAPPITAN